MDGIELGRHLRSMRELVGSGERDLERRTEADAAFRGHYRLLREEWDGIPADAAGAVKDAFLALVGDDDWTAARLRLEQAIDRLG
ncbi:MAG: hypothetical protein AB1941_00730 [Gemmatimonadota bacterium]